jgi:hypothetical protein
MTEVEIIGQNNSLALCEFAARAQTAQIVIGSPISLYLFYGETKIEL